MNCESNATAIEYATRKTRAAVRSFTFRFLRELQNNFRVRA